MSEETRGFLPLRPRLPYDGFNYPFLFFQEGHIPPSSCSVLSVSYSLLFCLTPYPFYNNGRPQPAHAILSREFFCSIGDVPLSVFFCLSLPEPSTFAQTFHWNIIAPHFPQKNCLPFCAGKRWTIRKPLGFPSGTPTSHLYLRQPPSVSVPPSHFHYRMAQK